MLHNRLAQAEGKFVMMTTTMERVHSVIEPLVQRTTEAQKLLRISIKLSKLLNSSHEEVVKRKENIKKNDNIL